MGKILVIDDEESLRKLLVRIISLEGFQVYDADSIRSGLKALEQHDIDVILCDVKLPDGNGVTFVREAKAKYPLVEIILLTAYGNIPDGVQAIKNGGFDYVVKGNDNDKVIPLLYQALEKSAWQKKTAVRINEKTSHRFDDIIGTSSAIQQAIQLAKRIAPTEASVLLLGETGTGKEVFANAIHSGSKRQGKNFVAINCAAFSKDLLEGELFGYKSGAFTGAVKDKAGLIELANGGTLFLDEIGDMNIDLQAKLLRVIENREFIKLGDTKTTHVDVRIIAATNKDLEKAIEEGYFREDLFYRLNVFTIRLPALKERMDDLPALVEQLIAREPGGQGAWRVHPQALKLLQAHSWKGNIRELKNVLSRAMILADGREILTEHLPYEIQKGDKSLSTTLSLAHVEKAHIEQVLNYAKGNKTRAAEYLGIGLTTLYRKLQEYGIAK